MIQHKTVSHIECGGPNGLANCTNVRTGNAYVFYMILYTSIYMEAVETAPFNGDSQSKL